ncbi:hypothetical protein B0T21DRAFT_367102 [Apiosordaria backusii]|uniref:Secreted protein n=1 Tax=Apiosordaria backusii TaxID=314023 RepID=A0AA40BLL9_9PEZI|nr:hypothetical protein B0T21DRAFT_367102 [Apiosordaria backusii]
MHGMLSFSLCFLIARAVFTKITMPNTNSQNRPTSSSQAPSDGLRMILQSSQLPSRGEYTSLMRCNEFTWSELGVGTPAYAPEHQNFDPIRSSLRSEHGARIRQDLENSHK